MINFSIIDGSEVMLRDLFVDLSKLLLMCYHEHANHQMETTFRDCSRHKERRYYSLQLNTQELQARLVRGRHIGQWTPLCSSDENRLVVTKRRVREHMDGVSRQWAYRLTQFTGRDNTDLQYEFIRSSLKYLLNQSVNHSRILQLVFENNGNEFHLKMDTMTLDLGHRYEQVRFRLPLF